MNTQITQKLAEAGFETRPTGSNGLWCSFLLPLITVLNSLTCDASSLYKIITISSLGLVSYSIIFINVVKSCTALKEATFRGIFPLSFIIAVVINLFTDQGFFLCLIMSFTSLYSYSYLLRFVLKDFPKTFTIGEALVVSQSLVLFTEGTVLSILVKSNYVDQEENFFQTVIFTVLTTVILIVIALNYLIEHSRNLTGLIKIICVAAIIEIFMLLAFLGPSVLPKLYIYLFRSYYRIKILALWLLLVIVAVLVLVVQTSLSIKADTSTRKTFHILASAVFLTGLLGDFNLMMFASGIGLALLILVEALRKSKIEPIASALQSAFVTYSDEKDCGSFAMTPIYLFCGLACPIALVPDKGHTLELLSGVLSIGVGDTAASFFGSRYGRVKWPGTNKTIEGMLCNALSQVALVALLDYFAYLPPGANITRTALAASFSALVEINTDQVDNLILPLVMLPAYRFTCYVV